MCQAPYYTFSYIILFLTTILQFGWQHSHLIFSEIVYKRKKKLLKTKIDAICFCLQSNGEMSLSTTPFLSPKEMGSDPHQMAHHVGRHVSGYGPLCGKVHQWMCRRKL